MSDAGPRCLLSLGKIVLFRCPALEKHFVWEHFNWRSSVPFSPSPFQVPSEDLHAQHHGNPPSSKSHFSSWWCGPCSSTLQLQCMYFLVPGLGEEYIHTYPALVATTISSVASLLHFQDFWHFGSTLSSRTVGGVRDFANPTLHLPTLQCFTTPSTFARLMTMSGHVCDRQEAQGLSLFFCLGWSWWWQDTVINEEMPCSCRFRMARRLTALLLGWS